MFTIKALDTWNKETYCEIGQTNALRWMNVKPTGEKEYTPVSFKWKCKDFMNEVVTSFNTGRDFSIYGFQVKYADFFSPGQTDLPMVLFNVTESWYSNMAVVNAFLESQGFPPVALQQALNPTIITLPGKYLENTFFMSQVTLFIRLANASKVYTKLEDMVNDPNNSGDGTNFANCVKKPLGKFSDKLKDYLWYYDTTNNLPKKDAKTVKIQTSLMHNCGVVNWGWNV